MTTRYSAWRMGLLGLLLCFTLVSTVYSINSSKALENNSRLEKEQLVSDSRSYLSARAPSPTITVLQPSASTIWMVGTTQTILWNYTGTFGNVNIILYSGFDIHSDIVRNIPCNMSYNWVIPTSLNSSSFYRIRIDSTTYPTTIYDKSDYFTIINTSAISVTSPSDSSSWQAGTTHNITWTSIDIISNVTIQLYKGANLMRTISASTPNNGSFSWTISSSRIAGTDYRIKISSTSDPAMYNYSAYFEIESFTVIDTSAITITSPSNSSSWQAGTIQNITWTSIDTISNVTIQLYKGAILVRTIAASTPNNGSYSWNISSSRIAGTDYRIKIISTSDPTVYNYSAYFEIESFPNGENGVPSFPIPFVLLSVILVSLVISILKKAKLKIPNWGG